MSGLPSTALAFGKIPTHGDFVRAGGRSETVDALDRWLQDGVAELKRQQPTPDPEVAPRPVHFVFVAPRSRDLLVGAMVMSRDRVGRRFPIMVGRAVPRAHLDPQTVPFWPVVWHDLLAASVRLAADAVESLSPAELAERTQQLPPAHDPRDRRLVRDHANLLHRTTSGEFWTSLWGDPDTADKYTVLMRLLEVLRPSRGGGGGDVGLAFPVVINGSPVCAEAFWLEAVWRLRSRRAELPVLAWPAGAPPGRFLVFPAGMPRHAAAFVLGAEPRHRQVVDLCAAPPRAVDAVIGLPSRYGRLLEHRDLSLADLLNGL